MTFEVLLDGTQVGTIEREADSLTFVVADAYARDPNRLVLSQQFEDRRSHHRFVRRRPPGKLPSFFDNLLPEGGLRRLVGAQISGGDDADLLALVGEDLPGAVVVRRQGDGDRQSAVGPTYEEPSEGADLASVDGLRFSLAGVQLKFSLTRNGRLAMPVHGEGGRYILKLGSSQFPDLAENESVTMTWAERSGITIPKHELVELGEVTGLDPRFAIDAGPRGYLVERYDRANDGKRIHQEDFAQVLGRLPEQRYDGISYEGLARLVADLCGHEALLEFVRRLVFLVLSGNTDAHLKNWSLLYEDGRRACLAPAYDLVFVRLYLPTDSLALAFANERALERISWSHFARLEKFLRLRGIDAPVLATARAFASRACEAWKGLADIAPAAYRERMAVHLAGVSLAHA